MCITISASSYAESPISLFQAIVKSRFLPFSLARKSAFGILRHRQTVSSQQSFFERTSVDQEARKSSYERRGSDSGQQDSKLQSQRRLQEGVQRVRCFTRDHNDGSLKGRLLALKKEATTMNLLNVWDSVQQCLRKIQQPNLLLLNGSSQLVKAAICRRLED